MLEMGKVASAVRESSNKTTRIIVGGAPVTQEFAHDIGADDYAEDALPVVSVALKLIGK
jgi:5-methyltetrahydrofolate--homocysteine methyltransferase